MASKKYSSNRYWRFVFTPLLLLVIGLGLYLLFTAPSTQLVSYDQLKSQIRSLNSQDIVTNLEKMSLK